MATDDFSIREDDCTGRLLVQGDGCAVWVRFVPSATGSRVAQLTLVDSTSSEQLVSLDAAVVTGHTQLTMESDSGDYIGQGETYDYSASNATFEASGSRRGIQRRLVGADGSRWSADFIPSSDDVLVSGSTYRGALRAAFKGSAPGLDVSGNGRGCNTLEGLFTVTAIEVKTDGSVKSVGITFEQHCEGERPALRGTFNYRTSLVPPQPITGLTVERSGDDATVTWSNPVDSHYGFTMVRYNEAEIAPLTTDSGTLGDSTEETSVSIHDLSTDRSLAVSAFAVSDRGAFAVPATRVAPSTGEEPSLEPARFTRSVTLQLMSGRANGRIHVADGPMRCARAKRVAVQRMQSGKWATIARGPTGYLGRYEVTMNLRSGRFRSVTRRTVLGDGAVCRWAASATVVF